MKKTERVFTISLRATVDAWRALHAEEAMLHPMVDLIYIFATLAFFGLMLVYVVACERLGRSAGADRGAE